jgi:uncharacterized protein (DUF1810 family)
MPQDDPFHLQRFLDAQADTYEQARAELAAGAKRSHWMWFIFPQIAGLGSSPISQRYAIADLPEARAYLQHAVLGPRLVECTTLVNQAGKSVSSIFGYPDDLKFHSSITLFAQAATEVPNVFTEALIQHFNSEPDGNTLARLR